MRLYTISEAYDKNYAGKIITKLGLEDWLDPDYLRDLVEGSDPSEHYKYGNFVLRLYQNYLARRVTEAPIENALDEVEVFQSKVRNALTKFDNRKKQLAANGLSTDINKYAPKDGEEPLQRLEATIMKTVDQNVDPATRGLQGVRLYIEEQDPNNASITYRVYHVTDTTSLCDIAHGLAGGDAAGWCTADMITSSRYANDYHMFVIFRNNQPVTQFGFYKTPELELEQVRNTQNQEEDRPINLNLVEKTRSKLKAETTGKISQILSQHNLKATNQTIKTIMKLSKQLVQNRTFGHQGSSLKFFHPDIPDIQTLVIRQFAGAVETAIPDQDPIWMYFLAGSINQLELGIMSPGNELKESDQQTWCGFIWKQFKDKITKIRSMTDDPNVIDAMQTMQLRIGDDDAPSSFNELLNQLLHAAKAND